MADPFFCPCCTVHGGRWRLYSLHVILLFQEGPRNCVFDFSRGLKAASLMIWTFSSFYQNKTTLAFCFSFHLFFGFSIVRKHNLIHQMEHFSFEILEGKLSFQAFNKCRNKNPNINLHETVTFYLISVEQFSKIYTRAKIYSTLCINKSAI